jgi:heme/copper-type cytochrome/quinol oxidase subunit 3
LVPDEVIEGTNGREIVYPGDYSSGPEDIHMPSPSAGPIIVGLSAMFVVLGVLQPLLLPVGGLLALFGIWKMGHFPEVDLHAQWLPQLNDRKLGMWVFLASEVMFFGSLIGAFVGFKINEGFEEATEILSLPLATVGTSVLIISSFAVVMGLEALQSNDRRVFRNWMLVTIALGLLFVSIQAFEWYELMHEEVTADTLFGTAFFVTTGFHGMHVLGGVAWLALLMFRARNYSADNYLGVELFGLYWHFVDVVWIVLFTVIYLIH